MYSLDYVIATAAVINTAALFYCYRLAYNKPPVTITIKEPSLRDTSRSEPTVAVEKVNFHIRRFTLALEQAEDERLKEEYLRNLTYWKAVKNTIEIGQG